MPMGITRREGTGSRSESVKPRALAFGLFIACFCLFGCSFTRRSRTPDIFIDFGEAKNQWGYVQYGQMGRKVSLEV